MIKIAVAVRRLTPGRAGNRYRIDEALGRVALGRAMLLEASGGEHNDAGHLDLTEGVEGLRETGQQHHLVCSLLVRAACHRTVGSLNDAWRDLREAHQIAERGKMQLYLADFHIEAAWLAAEVEKRRAYAPQGLRAAAEHLQQARALVDSTGYHRRDAELAALGGC